MKRDIWIYQKREIKEPFALHVWLLDDGDKTYMDIAIYSEEIEYGSEHFTMLKPTLETLISAVSNVLIYPDTFTNEDVEYIREKWANFVLLTN